MFISTERLSSPFLMPSSRSRRLTALLAGLRNSSRIRHPGLGEADEPAAGEVLHEQVEAYADGVEAPRPAEQVLGGHLALEPHPVGVDGHHVGVPVAHQVLDGVHGQPVRGRHARAAAQDLQQAGRGALRLVQDGAGQGPVAGDDVARDLQLVEGQLQLAPVVEVRLEAGPVLDHQLAQLGQRQEAEDVVVGRVQQVALAAGHLADGDGPLHPLLPRGTGGGDDPVVAVHRLVDRPQYGGHDRPQALFDQIQPDIRPSRALGAGAHLAPVPGVPFQLRADLHRPGE